MMQTASGGNDHPGVNTCTVDFVSREADLELTRSHQILDGLRTSDVKEDRDVGEVSAEDPTARGKKRWLRSASEGYVFVGLVFWTLCFAMSRYSHRLERSLRARSY